MQPTEAENILSGLLKDNATRKALQDLSVGELLQRLESDDFNNTLKLVLLALVVSELLTKIGNTNFRSLHDEFSVIGHTEGSFEKQKESFINKFNITEKDKLLLEKILEGIPLKCFKEEVDMSPSNANKKIRRLWQRLGLENRQQMIFVAGWMRLVSPELECLKSEEAS